MSYHVAPSGSPQGDGTASNPWPLNFVLRGADGAILGARMYRLPNWSRRWWQVWKPRTVTGGLAGEVIMLRPGTYGAALTAPES